ncbi:hypothetical protein [Spongiactinospora rosea]|uniref:hypothetical protein n=1 Tax=Spongiactinospora rosea TaxID=2248750 RepID=UPI0013149AE1|nr:hypothetical protein [Spongiactinospora rosea]
MTVCGRTPHPALGLVIDTLHKRIDANTITTLQGYAPLGLPTGVLAVDRAYTDQAADHFTWPVHLARPRQSRRPRPPPAWTTRPSTPRRSDSPG